MPYLLAIDCGLTVSKAVIISTEGKEVACGFSKPEVLYPQPGWVERDMEDLWNNVCLAVKGALASSGLKPEQIAGMSVTGHGNGIYCLDKSLTPARPGILSLDTRASDTLATLAKEGTFEKAHPKTGSQVWAASSVVLLRWLKDNEPDVFENIGYVCEVKDYIAYRITGELHTDHTDMSGAAFIDTANIKFSTDVLDAYGIPEAEAMLPEMFNPWNICGKVTHTGALETGLKEGTPVSTGGMDITMTALGSGCLDEGQLCIIVGTWSINGIITERPLINKHALITTTFCVPGRWYQVDASPSSASNLNWFMEQFCHYEKVEAEKRGISPFEIINEELAGMNPESCDIIFHPYLYGSNVQPTARAGFYGLGGWHKRTDLLRAIYEGVCFSHLSHVQNLRSIVTDKEAYIAGGGRRSEIWTQLFADILNIPIKVPGNDELGALGGAMNTAVALGIYNDHREAVRCMCSTIRNHEPDSNAHEIYMIKYTHYNDILEVMKTPWDRLYKTMH
jgi:L-xylulokinase